MNINFYFDKTHPLQPFTHQSPAGPGSRPPRNATRLAPETSEGFWPCWNGEAWEQVEDHRGLAGWIDGMETAISDFGPLPEGWSAESPEPTAEEKRQAEEARIKAELFALDLASIRPLRAIENGADAVEDHEKLVEIRKQAEALRVELRKLEGAE